MSDASLSELETHLGYWLRLVSNQVSGAFARALQQRQISVAEWVALRHLYARPGMTPGEIAESLGMTRGAISKVLDKLEAKELVVSQRKAEDNRSQTLSLTPKGTTLLPELAAIADENDDAFFRCLSADEQALLRQLLQKITDANQWNAVPVE